MNRQPAKRKEGALLGGALLLGGVALAGGVWFNQWKSQQPKAQTEEDKLTAQLRAGRQWANRHMLRLSDNSRHRIFSLAFSPSGAMLASGGREDHTIKLWDARQGILLRTLTGHRDKISQVVFAPDERTLVSSGFEKIARLWDIPSGKPQKILWGKRPFGKMEFSPDGKLLFSRWLTSTSHDKSHDNSWLKGAEVWDTQTGRLRSQQIVTLPDGPRPQVQLRAKVFSPDGATLATSRYANFKLQDARTGKLKINKVKAFSCGDCGITRLVFAPDGKTLVSSGADYDALGNPAGALKLWNVQTGKLLHTFDINSPGIFAVAFSPDGKVLVSEDDEKLKPSAMSQRVIKIWNVQTGELLHVVPLLASLGSIITAFSPDGKRLAIGGNGLIEIWKMN